MAYNTISQMDFGQAIATEDLTGKLHFAGVQTGEEVALPTAAGEAANVMIHTDAPKGISVRTVFKGVSKAVAGGTFSAGAKVATAADGRVVEATNGDVILGDAVIEATAENEVVTINFYGVGQSEKTA